MLSAPVPIVVVGDGTFRVDLLDDTEVWFVYGCWLDVRKKTTAANPFVGAIYCNMIKLSAFPTLFAFVWVVDNSKSLHFFCRGLSASGTKKQLQRH